MSKRSRAVVPLEDQGQVLRRPPAVTVVAFCYLLQGGLVLALIVGAVTAYEFSLADVGAPAATTEEAATLLGAAVACIALITASYGLFRLRPWAWTLTMSTQCLLLTYNLIQYLVGKPLYAAMTLGAISVLLMNQRDVRLIFEPKDGDRG